MGPARLQGLYLRTLQANRIAKRGIIFLDGPGALARYLKEEFGAKYPGEKLALASDLAVERLSEPHYWDDPAAAADDYAELWDSYDKLGVRLFPCLEGTCWSEYYDPKEEHLGHRPRRFFGTAYRRPDDQFEAERLVKERMRSRGVTCLRGADLTAVRAVGEEYGGCRIVGCKSQDGDVPAIETTLRVTKKDNKLMYMMLWPSRLLAYYEIDWADLALFIAFSEGNGDNGMGRTDVGKYTEEQVFQGMDWLREHLPPGDSPIDEYQTTVADRLQKFLKRNGTLPHEKGLAAEVAEAIVDALRRQERRNARPEIFVCAQYLWAEMVRRHDLY